MNISPETILEEMFHSDYFSEKPEARAICPECDDDYKTHGRLVNHIINRHPEYLKNYSRSLDKMLQNPLEYFSFSPNSGGLCLFCATDYPLDNELIRHIKRDHKDDFERFKEEMGKKDE